MPAPPRDAARTFALLAISAVTGCGPRPAPESPAATLSSARVAQRGSPSTPAALVEAARGADLACIGETHDDPRHHRLQRAILRALIAARHRPLALGLEMVQRPHQPVLDDYARGWIDERGLYRSSRWARRWSFDFAMYRPMLEDAHDYGVRMLALNAPRELTRAIARRGLDGLTEGERAALPRDIDLDDADHRRFFWAAMGFGEAPPAGRSSGEPEEPPAEDQKPAHGDPHGGASPERFYAAQVVWDETMAETAAAWIDRGGQIMVIAGNGHCHDHAIVDRVERRLEQVRGLSVLVRTGDTSLLEHVESDFVVTLPDA